MERKKEILPEYFDKPEVNLAVRTLRTGLMDGELT